MHKRLVHTSAGKMAIMHNIVDGVKQMCDIRLYECKICSKMKAKTAAIRENTYRFHWAIA